ncbi:MAG TPA: secretion system protein [Methanosarcinaceae archaeon]|nr:secretion system protein [Methanosarcinaceae archaeon]
MENNTPTAYEDDLTISDPESNAGLDLANAVESESSIPSESKKSRKKKVKQSKNGGKDSVSVIDVYTKKATALLSLFKKVPFVLLGDRMKAKKSKYANLQLKLKQARIPTSYEMYISNAIFYSIVSGLIGAILGIFTAYIVLLVVGLPDNITQLTFGPSTAWILDYKELIVAFFIIIVLTALLGGITYAFFMIYPGFQASERKGKIDRQLPYAVTFMYALTKGGMNIIDVFRLLARSEDTYGEVSKEVDTFIRDMDYFGHDLRTALANVSEMTPSSRFQDLMYNLLTVIDSGGNISKYFQDKADQYLQHTIIDQKGFLETLGLLAESYVTAFVAGPLFIIIMGVMMAVMGSGTSTMVYAIIYAVLPIGSVMFVVMISIITPGEMGEPALLPTKAVLDHGIPDVPAHLAPVYDVEGEVIDETEEKVRERTNFEKFIKSKKSLAFKEIIKRPLKPMLNNPMISLAVTLPIALLYVIIPVAMNIDSLRDTAVMVNFIDDRIVVALYIILIPLMLFHERKSRRQKKLDKSVPDFLKKLASTNETGMTLRDSIRLMAKSESEALSKEIKKIWKDIVWGLEINDALVRFANRLRTSVVARSLTLITKANESSGDIGEVLMVAARDAASEQEMKAERSMTMMIYIVIIYMSFLVFVGVIFVISTTFLAEMAAAGERMASSGSQGGFLGSFDLEAYTQLFKHAAIIQGVSSGLMAGAMGEGSVMAGLKHSVIMMTIGYVIFTMFV